jgi:hypothetical protein
MVMAGALSGCDTTPPTAPSKRGGDAVIKNRVHTPPVIKTMTVAVSRAEVDQNVAVSAVVEEAEVPVGQLAFAWSANAGTFSGAGPNVTWRLPKGAATTPLDVVISLTVTERWVDAFADGSTASHTLEATMATAPIRAHDSVAELTKMSVSFLVDKFGNSSVPPGACLVDFSDTCAKGKSDEMSDIVNNRATFVLLSAQAAVTSIGFNGNRTAAEVVAACTFRDRKISNGDLGMAQGDCLLTAIYEQGRWWLCTSNFNATAGAGQMFQFYRRKSTDKLPLTTNK